MPTTARVSILACLALVFMSNVRADSYYPFVDLQGVDRSGRIHAHVTASDKPDAREVCKLKVWTRLPPEGVAAMRDETAQLAGESPAQEANGPISTLLTCPLKDYPGLVRVSSTAVAVIDIYGVNVGRLTNRPALSIHKLSGEPSTEYMLEDLFPHGLARYKNGPSRINWVRDAWFTLDAKQLFVVSWYDWCNEHALEVVAIDMESGQVRTATPQEISHQIAEADDATIASLLDVAEAWDINDVQDVARRWHNDPSASLPARLRAATYLYRRGDQIGVPLLREIAAQKDVPVGDIKHPLLLRGMLYDEVYWRSTVEYAAAFVESISMEDDQ